MSKHYPMPLNHTAASAFLSRLAFIYASLAKAGVGRCLVEGVGRCLVEDCHNAVCVSANGS
eukprot:scaffold91376_cov40-Tisochrysis_lutea.AAC.1